MDLTPNVTTDRIPLIAGERSRFGRILDRSYTIWLDRVIHEINAMSETINITAARKKESKFDIIEVQDIIGHGNS